MATVQVLNRVNLHRNNKLGILLKHGMVRVADVMRFDFTASLAHCYIGCCLLGINVRQLQVCWIREELNERVGPSAFGQN
jgi:hypothetical protein